MKKKTLLTGILAAAMLFATGGLSTVYGSETKTLADYPQYNEIVQKYYEGASAGWDISQFQENNLCYLAGYYSDINKLGYCLLDVDSDGTDELFIGTTEDEGYEGMFFDMYTLTDGKAELVATSGERDRYYLCEDNTIANEGSSSAFLSVNYYYEYKSGKLNLQDGIVNDGELDPQNPWFYGTLDNGEDSLEPISEGAADSIKSKYKYMKLSFSPLSDIQ